MGAERGSAPGQSGWAGAGGGALGGDRAEGRAVHAEAPAVRGAAA